jgi:hypothetical protein
VHACGGASNRREKIREQSVLVRVCVCLLLQDLVQSCVRGEGGDIGGHVLRETTSRGLCGLVCPSRTSERGGGGDCVREGGGGEGKCEREQGEGATRAEAFMRDG